VVIFAFIVSVTDYHNAQHYTKIAHTETTDKSTTHWCFSVLCKCNTYKSRYNIIWL